MFNIYPRYVNLIYHNPTVYHNKGEHKDMTPQQYFTLRRDRDMDAIITRAIEQDTAAEQRKHGANKWV